MNPLNKEQDVWQLHKKSNGPRNLKIYEDLTEN